MRPATNFPPDVVLVIGAARQRDNAPVPADQADQVDAEWLRTSFAHARDLLAQIDYGAAIAATITKVQILLGADSASICLTENSSATMQHLLNDAQEVITAADEGGSARYPRIAEGAVLQRMETCSNCRLLAQASWCASAPLYAEGEQIGMLCAIRKPPRPSFQREQVRMLQLLALWSAIAITNARQVRAAQATQRSERERISAHLHDNAAQSLSVIGLQVEQVETALGSALGPKERQQLHTIKRISQQLMTQVRAAFGELRQADPQSSDLVTALADSIATFTQAAGLPVEFSVTGICTLPDDVQAQAIQVVREALNNVTRHARATKVQLKLLGDKKAVRIIVEDDGVGFDLHTVGADQRHLGTLLMRERAQRSGGTLTINSHPGRGTQVTLSYPAASLP